MPGSIGINVGGARIVRPGVYPRIDASAMVPLNGAPYGAAGVIGSADGGIPNKVYTFASFSEALAVLRGGACLSYLSRIFRPSPDLPGSSEVNFVRIGAPTQSAVTAAGVVFTAEDFGRHTQGVSVQIAVGASQPWDVTIRKRSDGITHVWSLGNGLEVMSTATTPKILFDHAAKQMRLYENALVVATLDYPTENVTLSNAVAFINGRVGWTARVKSGGDPAMPICFQDNPILASAPAILTSYVALPASQGMLIWILRDRDNLLNAVEIAVGTYAALSVVAETYLAGGTGTANDTFVLSDWTTALSKLETVDVQCLFGCTTDPTVRPSFHQHCLDMRTITRKRWRRFYTGSAPNETSATAITNAPLFDGPTSYYWNGTAGRNPITGLLENLGGLGVAAQAVGMRCGSAPCISLTNKPVVSEALEFPQPTDTEINQCLIAGVSPIALDPTTGRAMIVQAITCYQGGPNVTYRKEQGLTVADTLAAMFQWAVNDFIGKPMDLLTGQLLVSKISRALDAVVRTSQNKDGYITPGRQNGQEIPAWDSLSVNGDGMETWNVSVSVHPVGETAYIPVYCSLTPAPISL